MAGDLAGLLSLSSKDSEADSLAARCSFLEESGEDSKEESAFLFNDERGSCMEELKGEDAERGGEEAVMSNLSSLMQPLMEEETFVALGKFIMELNLAKGRDDGWPGGKAVEVEANDNGVLKADKLGYGWAAA